MGYAVKYQVLDTEYTRAVEAGALQGEPPSTSRPNVSNWVETTDGRMMCSFYTGANTAIKIGYCAQTTPKDAFLSGMVIEDVLETPMMMVGYSGKANQTALFRNPDGSVLLFREDDGVGIKNCKVFRSASGNGDDFIAHGTVFQTTLGGTVSGWLDPIYPPVRLSTGTLIFACNASLSTSGYYFIQACLYRSVDGGVTWSRRVAGGYTQQTRSGQPAATPGDIGLWEITSGSGQSMLYDSVDDGLTWVARLDCASNFGQAVSGVPRTGQYYGSYFYDESNNCLYRMYSGGGCRCFRLKGSLFSALGWRVSANWEYVGQFAYSPTGRCMQIYDTPDNYIVANLIQTNSTAYHQPLGLPYYPKLVIKARNVKYKQDGVVTFHSDVLKIAMAATPGDGTNLVVPPMPTISVSVQVVAGDIVSITAPTITVPDIPTIVVTTE